MSFFLAGKGVPMISEITLAGVMRSLRSIRLGALALLVLGACSDDAETSTGGEGGNAGSSSNGPTGSSGTAPSTSNASGSTANTTGAGGSGVSGDVTLTGRGFGENPGFAPLRFLDFCDVQDGATWAEAGGDSIYQQADDFGHGTATAEVTIADGIPTGCGSWEKHVLGDLANDGSNSDGPFHHEQLDIPPTDAFTVFKHVKIEHVAGLDAFNNPGAQYKGTRVGVATDELYQSTPRLAGSAFTSDGETGYFAPHWWRQGGDETVTGGGSLDIYDGAWRGTFMQGRLNSADGVADALYREWWAGTYQADTSDLDLRDDMNLQWRGVQINPGLANAYGSTGEWIVRHARVVVLDGLAWVAFGNAATFSQCTDLLAVEPTSWADGQISFNTRGTIPDGYEWVYVMNTDGVLVSEAGLTSFAQN
jgi:hypothetical protein